MNAKRLYLVIMAGKSDSNINFKDLRKMLSALGFAEKIKGDHYIFKKAGIADIINIQPIGNKAKVYQIRQIRKLLTENNLSL